MTKSLFLQVVTAIMFALCAATVLLLTFSANVKGDYQQQTPQQRINNTFDHPMMLEPTWPLLIVVETRIA